MALASGSISVYPARALESLGFSRATVSLWMHNAINDQLIPLEETFFNLGNPVVMNFHLQEPNVGLDGVHLAIQFTTEGFPGQVGNGSVSLPLQGLILPGWVMQVNAQIQNSAELYSMAMIYVSVTTELPANYPRPFVAPHVQYLNAGHMPPASQPQFYENPIFATAVTHFVGGISNQIGNEALNQLGDLANAFGDYFM